MKNCLLLTSDLELSTWKLCKNAVTWREKRKAFSEASRTKWKERKKKRPLHSIHSIEDGKRNGTLRKVTAEETAFFQKKKPERPVECVFRVGNGEGPSSSNTERDIVRCPNSAASVHLPFKCRSLVVVGPWAVPFDFFFKDFFPSFNVVNWSTYFHVHNSLGPSSNKRENKRNNIRRQKTKMRRPIPNKRWPASLKQSGGGLGVSN